MNDPKPTVERLLDPNRCRGWRYVTGTLTKRPCYALADKIVMDADRPAAALCDDCIEFDRVREEKPLFAV